MKSNILFLFFVGLGCILSSTGSTAENLSQLQTLELRDLKNLAERARQAVTIHLESPRTRPFAEIILNVFSWLEEK